MPACVCALVGLLQLLFLEPNPERVLGREDILELKQITCLPHAALTTENDLVCDDLLELEVGGKSCASGDASEGEMGCRHVDEFRSLNNCSSTDSIGHIDDYKQGDGNRNRHKNINNNRRSGQELSSVLNDKHHPITHACTRIDDQKTQTATSRQMHDTDAKFTERHGGQGAEGEEEGDESENISFMRALLVPGVIPNALCLFFSKLVAYSFIFWLPFYLQRRLGSVECAENI